MSSHKNFVNNLRKFISPVLSQYLLRSFDWSNAKTWILRIIVSHICEPKSNFPCRNNRFQVKSTTMCQEVRVRTDI